MVRIEYKEFVQNDLVSIEIKPILTDKNVVYTIGRESSEEWPVKFFTATTDMKDWIGNIVAIDGNTVSVEGYYRGTKQKISRIKPIIDNIKINERVMVTEHLSVCGKFQMLATKKRILDLSQPELNFINIGWSNEKRCRYLRIDPYTGESINILGNSVRYGQLV